MKLASRNSLEIENFLNWNANKNEQITIEFVYSFLIER